MSWQLQHMLQHTELAPPPVAWSNIAAWLDGYTGLQEAQNKTGRNATGTTLEEHNNINPVFRLYSKTHNR